MRALRHVAMTLLFGALGFASAAPAQPVTVQSGEHADFTRLVIDIGPDRDWQIGPDPMQPVVSFEPPITAFDTSRVFDLIPRGRLRDLSVGDGLTLDLTCACPISARRYETRYLILDISDPSADVTAAAAPSPDQQAARARQDEDGDAARRLAAAESLPDLTQLILHGAGGMTPPDAPDPSPNEPADIAFDDAAAIMAEQLARAAASGLIEAAPGRPLSDADPTPPDQTSGRRASDALDQAEGLAPHPLAEIPFTLPVRAETAVDAALHRNLDALPQRPRLSCTGEEFDLFSWSDGRGVDRGLGVLRLALYDDRDQLVPEAAIALARHYIFYGFGAEAQYWLSATYDPPEELVALAQLVDGADGPVFPPEPEIAICSDSEMLWRYIDRGGDLDLAEAQISQVQRAAVSLPSVLRAHLVPQIARHLAEAGHDSAARNMRDMLIRGGRLSETALLHLDMDLGLSTGADPGATREALAMALRDSGSNAPQAMAHALRFDREVGVPVSQTRIGAAEALLRESDIGPETAELWHELLLAEVRSGQVDQALILLSGPYPGPEALNRALTGIIRDRVEAEDTAALLLVARLHGAEWTATGSEAGRARVAAMAYLRDIGFPDAADELRGAQRMLILPARPGRPGSEASDAQIAWLAEDWLQLEGLVEEGPHRDLARRMQTATEAPDATAARAALDLAALTERLDDTRRLRQTIASILNDPTPDFRTSAP